MRVAGYIDADGAAESTSLHELFTCYEWGSFFLASRRVLGSIN